MSRTAPTSATVAIPSFSTSDAETTKTARPNSLRMERCSTARIFFSRPFKYACSALFAFRSRTVSMHCYVVSSLFLGVAALLKISIQGSIDTPMYMSSTNIIFNCMLGIYVGLALEQYCNLVIGIFIGNFILNMLTTGLLSMGLSASLQDTASGIFLLVIMIFTYNNQRVMNFISERKLKKELVRTNAQ